MAGRPRRPTWKRHYTSFRLGDGPKLDDGAEPQRLTLYLAAHLLGMAETLTVRAGAGSVQAYCERLLIRAIQAEQSRQQVDDAEARHGPLEGLRAIADDPEYLAEWKASGIHRRGPAEPAADKPVTFSLSTETVMPLPAPEAPRPGAVETILRHAGLLGDDPLGFLPCLRRGEAPPVDSVEELGAALVEAIRGLEGATAIDRRLAYALHRLAIESQVLHTDAWPDAFDSWTIDAIRAVQAAADRILSGDPTTY